jgi:hypothetical protein
MSNRVRLTRKAADGSIPYPGNVNQPGRTDPAWDQYHTFEQQVNHELPDMRTEWKDDSRDDIGFGVPDANAPTVASVRVAANKAVRIAVLLLGEKVSDSVIEAQARDLMSISSDAMDRTLDRFAKTQKLYAEECEEKEAKSKKSEDKEEEVKEEKKASASLADKGGAVPPAIALKNTEVKAEDKKEEVKEEVKAEDKKEEVKEEVKAEDKKEEVKEEVKANDDKDEDDKVEARLAKLETMIASIAAAVTPKVAAEEKKEEVKEEKKEAADKKPMPDFIQKKIDEKKEKEEKKAADEKDEKVEEKEASAKKSDDDADEDDKVEASTHLAGPNEMDIELTSSMDDALPVDAAADAQLASLFDDGVTAAEDEEEKDKAEKKAMSKKAGIKKLGGQPKVAATEVTASSDISSIWESAPDVSEVFK